MYGALRYLGGGRKKEEYCGIMLLSPFEIGISYYSALFLPIKRI